MKIEVLDMTQLEIAKYLRRINATLVRMKPLKSGAYLTMYVGGK